MDEQEYINHLREEILEAVEPLISKEDMCSFRVNTDNLKKQLEKLYPNLEVTITPIEGYNFEVTLKKMVNVISIEIDNDKIMEEIHDGR